MMNRISVNLQQDEREALVVLAEQERRDLRQQAAVILRQELERRGLLPISTQPQPTQAALSVPANPDRWHCDGDGRIVATYRCAEQTYLEQARQEQ
ncbi:MAG: hypothetical protein DRI81_12620 [Chloroflexi bacterium]|nr:MAG: hypothetical protein DRI81_12620 [Chloroflexota bacterium]